MHNKPGKLQYLCFLLRTHPCKHAYHLIAHSCLHVRTSHPFQIQVICVYMESRCNLIQTVRPHLPGAILVEGEGSAVNIHQSDELFT